jgi:hypothetical protein
MLVCHIIKEAHDYERKQFMKRQYFYLTAGLVITLLLVALFFASPKPSPEPPEPESFDDNPQTVILYFDIHYPGIPKPPSKPGDRYCAFIPTFRIWGDNLALYNEDTLHLINPQIGYLDSATRSAVMAVLVENGFLPTSPTELPPVLPSGMMEQWGVKLKSRPAIEYPKGIAYFAIINLIQPKLTPLSSYPRIDPRITQLLIEYENCNAY